MSGGRKESRERLLQGLSEGVLGQEPSQDDDDYLRAHEHGKRTRAAYIAKPEWVDAGGWHPAWRADGGAPIKDYVDTSEEYE